MRPRAVEHSSGPETSSGALIWLYRAAYLIARMLLVIVAPFHRKIGRGVEMRKRIDGKPPWLRLPRDSRPIWFHCASGEFEYAKPVIRRIKAENPHAQICVTYFSPSAIKSVETFPGVDFSSPAPWDQPSSLREFIEHVRPCALLIARTDAWPEMTLQAKLHGIPSLLFSATLTETSRRSGALGRPFARLSLAPIDAIYCVGKADFAAFASLGFGAKTSVRGDARFDQVLARLAEPKPIKESLFAASRRPLLLAGSTWSQDESELIVALKSLAPAISLCLVPHEPSEEHLLALEKRLAEGGWESVRYSKVDAWPKGSVLLVDQIGILAELYTKANLAFVGGSFRKSAHSVMEPLACGLRTFVGPFHENNREALDFKIVSVCGLPAVVSVASGEELAARVREALAIDSKAEMKVRESITAQVKARSGASQSVIDWLPRV